MKTKIISEKEKELSIDNIKKQIEVNFNLEVYKDPWNRLWIKHKDYNIRIMKFDNGNVYFSADNEDWVCDNDDSVLYGLLKYCKDAHKWGDFNNNN